MEKWQADAKKHGLNKTTVVATPSYSAPHVAGTAFNATIITDEGKILNAKKWKLQEADDIAKAAGLKLNVAGDYIHFNLIKRGVYKFEKQRV